MSGYLVAGMQLWVHLEDGTTENALQMEADETNFVFSAQVSDMDLYLNINRINSAKIIIDSCTFANPSALKIKVELNNIARVVLLKLNPYFAENPFEVPSNIAGIFELSDLYLGYYDDYVYVGATPTFLAPTDLYYIE